MGNGLASIKNYFVWPFNVMVSFWIWAQIIENLQTFGEDGH